MFPLFKNCFRDPIIWVMLSRTEEHEGNVISHDSFGCAFLWCQDVTVFFCLMSLGRPPFILYSYANAAYTKSSIAIETGRVPPDQLLRRPAAAYTTQVRGLDQDLRVRSAPRGHGLRAGRVAPRRAQPGRHDRHHAKFLQPQ